MAKRKQSASEPGATDPRTQAAALLRRVIDDPALRAALAELIGAAGESAGSGEPAADAGGGRGRLLLLGTVAGVGVLAASSGLRSKVLDALFGAEEEFQYTPPAGGPDAPGAV
jgi:hypothetical protein